MERFVAEQNIRRYQELLEHASDSDTRRVIERLLENEREKLRNADDHPRFSPRMRHRTG